MVDKAFQASPLILANCVVGPEVAFVGVQNAKGNGEKRDGEKLHPPSREPWKLG